jgi:hypothetical protein
MKSYSEVCYQRAYAEAIGGPQQPTGPSPNSSEDEGDGEEAAPKALKV